MNDLSLGLLFAVIVVLTLMSAFFSAAETGMFSLNRYRLRHLSKNNKAAQRAQKLLEHPDRLISTILIGNTLMNNLAAAITTVIALRIFGTDSVGIAVGTGAVTLFLLIFAEITPKTFSALHPERVAFPSSLVLKFLLLAFYPVVWLINHITMPLLKLAGLDTQHKKTHDQLSPEELRTIVDEAGSLIPLRHQYMLRNILDLESATVEDIMVPRGEMFCIDLDDSEADILKQLETCEFTRVPVYQGNIDNIIGILHMRNLGKLLSSSDFNKQVFRNILREPIFSPENTDLHTQLVQFQKDKRRISIVIDEYGTVLGLATLEDILEEIVGNFTSNLGINDEVIEALPDGSLLIPGSTPIREINRQTGWKLPLTGPKTLSGLVLEHLESFPDALASVNIDNYIIEMVELQDNVIEKARVFPLNPTAGQTGFLFR